MLLFPIFQLIKFSLVKNTTLEKNRFRKNKCQQPRQKITSAKEVSRNTLPEL